MRTLPKNYFVQTRQVFSYQSLSHTFARGEVLHTLCEETDLFLKRLTSIGVTVRGDVLR